MKEADEVANFLTKTGTKQPTSSALSVKNKY